MQKASTVKQNIQHYFGIEDIDHQKIHLTFFVLTPSPPKKYELKQPVSVTIPPEIIKSL